MTPPDAKARGPLSNNIALDDAADVATVYGVKITGDLLRTLGEVTPPGIWFRIVKVEGETSTIEQTNGIDELKKAVITWRNSGNALALFRKPNFDFVLNDQDRAKLQKDFMESVDALYSIAARL